MAKNTDKKETEYEEVVVRRNKLNIHTLTFAIIEDKKPVRYQLRIFPGVNRITDPKIIECINNEKCNAGWKSFLKKSRIFPHGCHEIITGQVKKGTKQTTVFTAMDNATCKLIIEETTSIEQLELMHADEQKHGNRSSIISAILTQIDDQKSEQAGVH